MQVATTAATHGRGIIKQQHYQAAASSSSSIIKQQLRSSNSPYQPVWPSLSAPALGCPSPEQPP